MDDPARYEIRVAEHLEGRLAQYFGGLELLHADRRGETIIRCEVADQPALFGVLAKIRDLGLTLISLERMDDVPLFSHISTSGKNRNNSGGDAV